MSEPIKPEGCCAFCGQSLKPAPEKKVSIAIEMAPAIENAMAGPGGKRWFLCVSCHASHEPPKLQQVKHYEATRVARAARSPSPERDRPFAFTGETGTYVPDDESYW